MTDKRFSGLAGQEYDVWAKAVPHYEEMQSLLVKHLFQLLRAQFPDEVASDFSKRYSIIELGCGTGYTTKKLLSEKECYSVMAIDNEPVMLEQARVNIENEDSFKNKKTLFYEFDALEFLNECLLTTSNIASAMTIHNFEKKYRNDFLKATYDRLEPGGIFINADKYALDDPGEHQKTLDRQIQQFNKVAEETSNLAFEKERTEHYLRDNEPDLLMKQQEAIDEMKRIGFKDIQIIFRAHMEAILVARK